MLKINWIKKSGFNLEVAQDGNITVSTNLYIKREIKQIACDKVWEMIVAEKKSKMIRFTNNKNEVALVESGLLRSKNHADNTFEKGISVADGAHYSVCGYKYGYAVTGEVIGTGSDGEPLLDVKTMQCGKMQTVAAIVKADRAQTQKAIKAFCKKYNWTQDQVNALIFGTDGYYSNELVEC
jgi:hypothetical protein